MNRELTLEATVANTETVTGFVEDFLNEIGCSMRVITQINVAVDELFSNIAHYAYAPKTGEAAVILDISDDGKTVTVTFEDSGIPYNPLNKKDPDVTLSADERQIGGLGIYMVKKTMDDVIYEYRDGKNILSIVKKVKD